MISQLLYYVHLCLGIVYNQNSSLKNVYNQECNQGNCKEVWYYEKGQGLGPIH